MRKLNITLRACFFLILSVLFLNSCKPGKPEKKHQFSVKLKTWYRVSPAAPSRVVVNGIAYVSLANLVVSGVGTGTFIGEVHSFANTLSYGNELEGAPAGGIGAPVAEIPGYPVTGGPLPLIQAGDFAALPRVISSLNIPARSNGHIVNLVLFDDKGDAIFISNTVGTGTSTVISPTIGGYTNKAVIAGGTGKFRNASGELENDGYFSFVAPYSGEDNYKGWITY